MQSLKLAVSRAAISVALFALTGMAVGDVTTFDNGTEDWSVSGRNDLSPVGGNPDWNMDVVLIDVFGADIRNTANSAFIGDYTALGPIRLTVDVRVDSIDFFGTPVTRDIVVELRDNTPSSSGAPYVSVWYLLGTLTADEPGWRTFSVDLLDPMSETLPDGWGGTGDEDPNTFEPILPADRTFRSVLESVDEIHFTTFVPGYFFGFTNFDMAVDNVGFLPLQSFAPGDVNCDGTIDFFDIDPFLLALFNAADYPNVYPDCDIATADVNNDGAVDFFDIDPFVATLFGG